MPFLLRKSVFTTAPLALYSLMLFFVFAADAMMSYIAPIIIEQRVGDVLIMGAILSSSSLFGITADFFISKQFVRQNHLFFSKWLLALALFFPMIFLFFPLEPLFFLLAMAVWGVYYEFLTFSQYNFVHSVVSLTNYTKAWAVLNSVKSTGILVAPVIASMLLVYGLSSTLVVVIFLQLMAVTIYFGIKRLVGKTLPAEHRIDSTQTRSLSTQLKLWWLLFRSIWPACLFLFVLVLVETSFWTVGPLLSEHLSTQSWQGRLLLPAFIFPALLTPYFVVKLGARFGKKRTAFLSAVMGGVILCGGLTLLSNTNSIIFAVFIAALFISLDYPEIEAVFEDYINRTSSHSNDIIGLQGMMVGLAYITGPVLSGILSRFFGYNLTIGIFAFILAGTAAWLLIVSPRKTRLPQHELALVTMQTQK